MFLARPSTFQVIARNVSDPHGASSALGASTITVDLSVGESLKEPGKVDHEKFWVDQS